MVNISHFFFVPLCLFWENIFNTLIFSYLCTNHLISRQKNLLNYCYHFQFNIPFNSFRLVWHQLNQIIVRFALPINFIFILPFSFQHLKQLTDGLHLKHHKCVSDQYIFNSYVWFQYNDLVLHCTVCTTYCMCVMFKYIFVVVYHLYICIKRIDSPHSALRAFCLDIFGIFSPIRFFFISYSRFNFQLLNKFWTVRPMISF